MKKTIKILAMAALIAVVGLTISCPEEEDTDSVNVTFSSLAADGNAAQTTTALTLTFSDTITGLAVSDITLSGVNGVDKGALSNDGSEYTLLITPTQLGGELTVTVAKTGYTIANSSKKVNIYYYNAGNPSRTLQTVTANGNASITTTELTLTFNEAIAGLTAADIALSGVSATKGTLSGAGPAYTLSISGITASGELNVTVAKAGFNISGSPKPVNIFYAGSAPSFPEGLGSGLSVHWYNQATGALEPYTNGASAMFSEIISQGGFGFKTWYYDPILQESVELFQLGANIVDGKLIYEAPNQVPVKDLGDVNDGITPTSGTSPKGAGIAMFAHVWSSSGSDLEFDVFLLANKNNLSEVVGFIYATQNTSITGIDGIYWENIPLKQGWNAVKVDLDRYTVNSFSGSLDNYAWVANLENIGMGEDGGGPSEAIPFSKVSGTIDPITVNGIFPAGGYKLETDQWVFDGQEGKLERITLLDRTTSAGSNTWEYIVPSTGGNDFGMGFHLILTVYPTVDRLTSFEYHHPNKIREGTKNPTGNTTGGGDPIYEITGVKVDGMSIATTDISITVSGAGTANAIVYANTEESYRMTMNTGTRTFMVPNEIIWPNNKGENWMWFTLETIGGQRYSTKGRVNVSSGSATLNIANMYLIPPLPGPGW